MQWLKDKQTMTARQFVDIVRKHKRFADSRVGGIRADLTLCDLSGLRLPGINLQSARLSGANLSRCMLAGADLSFADLFGADLSGANLFRADMRGAHLMGTRLPHSILDGGDLRPGALIDAAIMLGRPHVQKAEQERAERLVSTISHPR